MQRHCILFIYLLTYFRRGWVYDEIGEIGGINAGLIRGWGLIIYDRGERIFKHFMILLLTRVYTYQKVN